MAGCGPPSAGGAAWGSGFLPSIHAGVQCRSEGDPVLYVSDPKGMSRQLRRMSLDALQACQELHRGPAVLQCIHDCRAGRVLPLDVVRHLG